MNSFRIITHIGMKIPSAAFACAGCVKLVSGGYVRVIRKVIVDCWLNVNIWKQPINPFPLLELSACYFRV